MPSGTSSDLRRALGAVLAAAASLCAQTRPDPTAVLARARGNLMERAERLGDYMCVQTVDRSYFKRARAEEPPPSCGQMAAEKQRNAYNLNLRATDRLRLEVKVSGPQEIASWAGESRFDSRTMRELTGGGPYSTGSLGTMVNDIFVNGLASLHYAGEETANGAVLFTYGFSMPAGASHYFILTGRDRHKTAYSGTLWIDPDSADLRRLVVRTGELPPETGACEATTTADYRRTRVGTGEFLLPWRSTLHFLMRDTTEVDTVATYSACREYSAESAIRFDDVTPAGGSAPKASPRAAPLPPGLSVTLVLAQPIDTDTAAAGDIVLETVRKPVRAARSREILIPAGATVEGRITQMQLRLEPPKHITISILLQKLKVHGVSTPFYARLDRTTVAGLGLPVRLPPPGPLLLAGEFVFPVSHGRHIMPRGYRSDWLTVAPPPLVY
jgi:hypothetical protein